MNNQNEQTIFESFFKSSHEAMFISSRDGNFIDVNNAFAQLLGFQRLDLIGKAVSKILADDSDRLKYQNMIETHGVVHQYSIALKHKNGTILPCAIDAIVWSYNGSGGYHGLIRTKNDLVSSFDKYFGELKREKARLLEQRKNIVEDSKSLARYFDDDSLNYMQKTGKDIKKASRKEVSILFFDIRNSTHICEQLEPDVFARFLNEIFTDIIDLIYGCKGHVNKLLGDGIMAIFGAPTSTGEDAINAVDAGLRILNYLNTFNDVLPDYLIKPVEAGIGVATGNVFAGIIGSIRREEYTVIGNAVNTASRLEKLTKRLKIPILFDEATQIKVQKRFQTKKVYQGLIRGKAGELSIYTALE